MSAGVIVRVTDTDARIRAAGPVPPLPQWAREALIRLMDGPVSDACRARIEAVLVEDERQWCDR